MSKKSYSCNQLNTIINFLPDVIKYCCSCSLGLGYKINDFSNINIDKTFFETRDKYISNLQNGNFENQETCRNCAELIPQKPQSFLDKLFSRDLPKKDFLIEKIIVNHFKQCDCKCIYCSQEEYYRGTTQNYNLLPILKQLYEQNMINREKLQVEFQGGNVSVLKEFDDIVELLFENGCRIFCILTNAIKYLPVIEKISQEAETFLTISLDSGTRETFQKIKQVDAFDTVKDNIKQWNEKSNARILLKYIIIKGVNDNTEELNNFLMYAKSIRNLHAVILEIDYRDTFISNKKTFNIPQHYYDLYKYAENFCNDNRMPYEMSSYTKKILKDGFSNSVLCS